MKRNISEKVILTNQCNCYCTYCYQQNKIDWVLSYDIAKKRINQLKSQLKNKEIDNIYINLFGGEPMLNWAVFELYLEEFGNHEHVLLSTITNGTLINQAKIDVIKKCNNFQLSISYDGDEDNHTRFLKSYGPLNDLVEKNISKLIKNDVYPIIRMGISKKNIKNLKSNLIKLKEIGVREIVVQTITAEGYTLSSKEIQKAAEICDEIMTIDFRIKIFSKKPVNLENAKVKKEGVCGCNGIFNILQANGVLYVKNVFEKTDLLDSEAYLVRYDDPNLKYIGIPEITDLSTDPIRHKIVKKDN